MAIIVGDDCSVIVILYSEVKTIVSLNHHYHLPVSEFVIN